MYLLKQRKTEKKKKKERKRKTGLFELILKGQSASISCEMTKMLELSKSFIEAVILKTLQQAITSTLETNDEIKSVNKEIGNRRIR